MRTVISGAIVSAVGSSLCLAAPAQAASCWNADTISAARIMEMKTLMMAVTVRCQLIGAGFNDTYNMFVQANHREITDANKRLEAHFAPSTSEGKRELDSFSTHVANLYGGGRTDRATCATFAMVAQRGIDEAVRPQGLAMLAAQVVREPHHITDRCGAPGQPVYNMASNAPLPGYQPRMNSAPQQPLPQGQVAMSTPVAAP